MTTRWSVRIEEDLRLRGLRPATCETYGKWAAAFFQHCGVSPARVEAAHVRAWHLELHRTGYQPRTINVAVSALRTFFRHTMQRPEVVAAVRNVRVDDRLPELLSAAEVASLIDHGRTPKHRAMLMLFYGTGMRTSELTHLRVCDVDGERAVIHLRDTKSRRDRIVPLPERAREAMRAYWCGCRVRPRGTDLLFPGRGQPLTRAAVVKMVRNAASDAGITRRVWPHLLRHCFATQMLEAGCDLRSLQILLGHRAISSTTHYLQLSTARMATVGNPLDRLRPQGEQQPPA